MQMGDMADWYMENAYEHYEEDLSGGELGYNRSWRGPRYRPGYKYRDYQSPICKSCGKSLVWGLSDKGNHMLCERDGFTPHKCSAESVFSAYVEPEKLKEVKPETKERDWLWP
jgi:hypothetical protein